MHIILGLIALLTAAAGVIFWLRMISRATKGAIELTEDVRLHSGASVLPLNHRRTRLMQLVIRELLPSAYSWHLLR